MKKKSTVTQGVLETILDEIVQHDRDNPDHGTGCACHDKHAGAIRRLMSDNGIVYGDRSSSNFRVVLSYVMDH